MIYRDKSDYSPNKEKYVRHYENVTRMLSTSCEPPVHVHCTEHDNHMQIYIENAYEAKRQQCKESFDNIRSEVIFSRCFLLSEIKTDVKKCHNNFSEFHSEMLRRAQKVKDYLDNISYGFHFKHRCLRQIKKISCHIARMQTYEYKFEHSTTLQSLLTVKKLKLLHIKTNYHIVHHNNIFIIEALIKKNVINFLSEIHTTERKIRKVRIESLLKLMPGGPELHNTLTIKIDSTFRHISFLTSDRLWVIGGKNKITLTNITGDILDQLHISCGAVGFYTVNNKRELFYIDSENNINKYSIHQKTTTIFIQATNKTCRRLCVYWSSLSRKLLVGMHGEIKGTFKLTWYSQTGHLTKTVQFNNTEINLCQYPRFITENNNGDIVVSGPCAVVVTDHGGGHRFSYTGHPFGSIFFPRGICTDALSHILVSEKDTVQLIDVDGNFLSYLLIRPPGIFYPYSLSYDVRSHRLCVAAWNKICVYRYITRHDFLSGKAFYAEVNRMSLK